MHLPVYLLLYAPALTARPVTAAALLDVSAVIISCLGLHWVNDVPVRVDAAKFLLLPSVVVFRALPEQQMHMPTIAHCWSSCCNAFCLRHPYVLHTLPSVYKCGYVLLSVLLLACAYMCVFTEPHPIVLAVMGLSYACSPCLTLSLYPVPIHTQHVHKNTCLIARGRQSHGAPFKAAHAQYMGCTHIRATHSSLWAKGSCAGV
jgi:hypothetical protein